MKGMSGWIWREIANEIQRINTVLARYTTIEIERTNTTIAQLIWLENIHSSVSTKALQDFEYTADNARKDIEELFKSMIYLRKQIWPDDPEDTGLTFSISASIVRELYPDDIMREKN